MNSINGKKTAEALVSVLKNADSVEKSALLGFDACIDTLVSVVKQRHDDGSDEYYSSPGELGGVLLKLGTKSCGLELKTKISRPGGNMAITANALGRLGVKADCIGTFGYPDINPVYRAISPACTLHTVADTITATALEFDVSKIIIFDPGPYNHLSWEDIVEIVSIDQLKKLASGKKLISFLNWSEIANSTSIWKRFLDDIFSGLPQGDKKIFFTDFSDCSRKSKSEITEATEILHAYRKYFRVVLSLNVNESLLVAKALGVKESGSDEQFLETMHKACNVDIILIHRINDALAYDGSQCVSCDTFFTGEPKILTGGGDNFNAGFCYSSFFDLDLSSSLLLANSVAGYYVREGHSPDIDGLVNFLSEV